MSADLNRPTIAQMEAAALARAGSNMQKPHNAPDLDALQREAQIAGLGRSVTELVTRLNAAISSLRAELFAARQAAQHATEHADAAIAEVFRLAEAGKPTSGDLISREATIAAIEGLNHGASMVRAKQSVTDRAVAAIRALPAAPAVKVKPLVWVDTGQRSDLLEWLYAVSGTLKHTVHPVFAEDGPFFEHYGIRWSKHEGKWTLRFWVGNNGLSGVSGEFDNLEAAKAAAQADYEARILAALEGGAP